MMSYTTEAVAAVGWIGFAVTGLLLAHTVRRLRTFRSLAKQLSAALQDQSKALMALRRTYRRLKTQTDPFAAFTKPEV